MPGRLAPNTDKLLAYLDSPRLPHVACCGAVRFSEVNLPPYDLRRNIQVHSFSPSILHFMYWYVVLLNRAT